MAVREPEPWREPRSEMHWMVTHSRIADLRALVTGWRDFANLYREYHGDDAAVAKAIQKCANELNESMERLFPPGPR
jgi:20S proteasome alpha/beta subunit